VWSVFLLGITQGFTEFLPISSSGHLIVMKAWLGVASPGAALEVALHVGTLMAIFWACRQWLFRWGRDLWRRDSQAWGVFSRLAVASVPAGIIGLLLGRLIENYFSLDAVIVGWLCTSLFLVITPGPLEGSGTLKRITFGQATLIGAAQALALWPGLSRSGATITMARILGIHPEDAAQFSFLMAIPAVLGASVVELPIILHSTIPGTILVLATLLAAISGVIAIKWVKGIVSRPGAWRGFAVYTTTVAVVAWIIGG